MLQDPCELYSPGAAVSRLAYRYIPLTGKAAQGGPVTHLIASLLGKFMVVSGAVMGGMGAAGCTAHQLTLVPEAEVAKDSTTVAAAAVAGGALAEGGGEAGVPYVDVRGLWRRLKDELVLPLVADVCRSCGVDAPQGLLLLPGELLERCLAFLPVRPPH